MIGIDALGKYLPRERLSVDGMCAAFGIAPQAFDGLDIVERTVPGPEDHPAFMAAEAVKDALAAAQRSVHELDAVIFAGVAKDYPDPWVAAFGVVAELDATQAAAFDVSGRCAGVVDALWVARGLIASGDASVVAVCTGDRFDHWSSPSQRPARLADALCGAGGAAAIVTNEAKNELLGYRQRVNPDARYSTYHCPGAGGTRRALDEAAVLEGLHHWHTAPTGLSLKDIAERKAFLVQAQQEIIESTKEAAAFGAIDFLAGGVLNAPEQRVHLSQLGIRPEQSCFPVGRFGHLGPTAAFLSMMLARENGDPIGPRAVLSMRANYRAASIAIRGQREDLGVRMQSVRHDERLGASQ